MPEALPSACNASHQRIRLWASSLSPQSLCVPAPPADVARRAGDAGFEVRPACSSLFSINTFKFER